MKNLTFIPLILLLFSPGVLLAQRGAEQIEAALKSSDSQKLDELLKSGINPDVKNSAGDPFMVTAAIWPEMLEKFIAAGGDVNDGGKSDLTPLIMAASMSSEQSVKMLTDAGADVNYAQKSSGLTALHYATWRSNCAKCVEHLLAAGADVNAQDKNKETPATLMITAMSPEERANTVQYTTNAYKNFGYENLPDRFTNPKAADWDEPSEIMGLLVATDMDPDLKNKAGVNALMNAAYFNKVDIMDKLVKKGGDLKAKDKSKKTVWTHAVDGAAGDAMAYMIENKIAGLDDEFDWFDAKTGTNMKGMTALGVAAKNGSAERLKTLLAMGAKCYTSSSGKFFINGCLANVKNKTPFIFSIESGKVENVKVLIEGCDKKKLWGSWTDFSIEPGQKNMCEGMIAWTRPWDYAEFLGHSKIAEYLKKEFDTYTLGKSY